MHGSNTEPTTDRWGYDQTTSTVDNNVSVVVVDVDTDELGSKTDDNDVRNRMQKHEVYRCHQKQTQKRQNHVYYAV